MRFGTWVAHRGPTWFRGVSERLVLKCCTGRSWAIAENMWLQLPLSSERSLSAERITLVIVHFELCCPSLLCLRLCRGLGPSASSRLALSHANPAALIKSLCKIVHGISEGRIRPWAVLSYVGLWGDARDAWRVCQVSYKRVSLLQLLLGE